MKGMELSKAYFEEYGREMIDSRLSMYREYMAVGLVGEGSECFGFDDQLSTDHDFGPAFCIWIPENLYDKAGAAIQEEYDRLPRIIWVTDVNDSSGRGQSRPSYDGRLLP